MPEPSRHLSRPGEIARRHDPDRFLCALFAPPARREAIFTLIAFNHELARAREATTNPLAALIRLTWWREAVEEAAAGKPPREHEVAKPLHAAIREGALHAPDLIAMAEAREAEAEEEGFASTPAFHAWLRGTAGGWCVAAGRALGAPPALLPALQEAGMLYGLAGVLRSVPALAAPGLGRQGRCLLPTDVVEPASVLADPTAAAPALRALAAAAPPAPDLRALPREAIAAALPLVLARRDLRRLSRGKEVHRGLMDRLAVIRAGLLART
jgi:phytoene synthase